MDYKKEMLEKIKKDIKSKYYHPHIHLRGLCIADIEQILATLPSEREMVKGMIDKFHNYLVTKDYQWMKKEENWKALDVYTGWLEEEE
jgi:hypothetical protein